LNRSRGFHEINFVFEWISKDAAEPLSKDNKHNLKTEGENEKGRGKCRAEKTSSAFGTLPEIYIDVVHIAARKNEGKNCKCFP
jgi:hypothetical protein